MKLVLTKIHKKLNKAYLKQDLTREQIENFKSNLTLLFEKADKAVQNNEHEEHFKNIISDFLKDCFYKNSYEINIKKRNDLVIHNGKSSSDSVAVIVEAKKPSNINEMISERNPNSKAMHELLHYYMQERYINDNKEIKHLIATNGFDWYIFDAMDFERFFYHDKRLRKSYDDWNKGLFGLSTTDWFYTEVAKPYLEKELGEIEAVHFNLKDYRKVIENADKKDDVKLIELYKILSPEHLLKKPFANDSNTLNKEFYNELLYILGLEERKDGSKKLIGRKEKDRNEGSLLENAINILKTRDKLRAVSNLKQYGENSEEQYYSIGLELCITWLNRILFLKLLEGQLIRYHKGDKKYTFIDKNSIGDFDELDELFFEVLAVKASERSTSVKEKFGTIPYLNSSLFEISELENQTIQISDLKDRLELPVYRNSVLMNKAENWTIKKKNTLHYLFEFLSAYNFSSDSGATIQEENKTLINASVLGLIFEKINGYKDGSFFTPGFITMYMCRETIRRAVVQKFNESKAWNCEDFNALYNQIDNKAEANDLINSLKICDPAVGSGHFLVSALNEMIAIKSELGLLMDKDGKRLKDYQFEVVNDELIVSDEDGKPFEYNYQNKESQRVQETMFHEKQRIIENCLFGVDINPNSVKICRLRLWIELLKNAYYKAENELETLPNIDINIKCGNSLVSRFAIDADLGQALKKSKWNIEIYKSAVQTYREAKSKDEKRGMEKLIADIKGDFRSNVDTPLKKSLSNARVKVDKIATEINTRKQWGEKIDKKDFIDLEKANQKLIKLESERDDVLANKIYENAFEWRFEFPEVLNEDGDFVGFDCIIGNPPYIYNRDIDEFQRNYFKTKYKSADDLYVYFAYHSVSILKSKGQLSLITPNTYFTLSTRLNFRRFLLSNSNLCFTYSGYCFEDAYVETMIFSLVKNKLDLYTVDFIPEPNDYLNYETYPIESKRLIDNLFSRFFVPNKANLLVNNLINEPLKELATQFVDILSGKGINEEVIKYNQTLKPGDITLLGLISDGEQGLVTGNNSRYIGNIIYDENKKFELNNLLIKKLNEFLGKKISFSDFESEEKLFEFIEELKKEKKKTDLLGKFYLYRNVFVQNIKHFTDISNEEMENGGDDNLWIFYNKGNSEGFKWFVPYNECINWSIKNVKELKEGILTNSRWQGSKYYSETGFGWVDYFTNKLKSFFVEQGVYSKNIVKLHSFNRFVSDKYIISILNSSFISYYVKNFITSTHTLQINDGRLIPIYIPLESENEQIEKYVDQILEIKKQNPQFDTIDLENQIDQLVYKLYGLTEDEIRIVEGGK